MSRDWILRGAPWDCSGAGWGEQDAPAALRRAGLADGIAAHPHARPLVVGGDCSLLFGV